MEFNLDLHFLTLQHSSVDRIRLISFIDNNTNRSK